MSRLKRIVLIGPVYPYKGGISHYTGLLCKALRKKYDVIMVSYKMQYPKLLFKKEQRDFSNDSFRIEDTKFWLNTANPFNIVNTAFKIRRLKPDLVIFQWWHPYFAPCYWILSNILGQTERLFVCHNVFPHERFPMDRFLTKMVMNCGNLFITHSKADLAELKNIRKSAKGLAAVHPTYNAFKITGINCEQAREQLKVKAEEKMLLFFGFVRPYKGLDYLLEALPFVKGSLPDVCLWIVGDFGEARDYYLEKIKELEIENIVRVVEGYIPDRDVEPYFAACDLVVLPYVSATQSGIAQIAYGFDKPVIATGVGGLPEVVLDGKTGYIVTPRNATELAEKIIRFFEEDREKEFSANVAAEAGKYSWEVMADNIEKLWQERGQK
ncbi:MAG: glycosyltransferase [Lachnospiraceae bacterium]|jgi:glycosyltransferase involved in cell wall biosynthesis|nr:glycosyltransferase [Lachnospiraceae bacterium]